ncbi:DUF6268 family outer membrane beta-barrel protein [Mucilaginibacter sp. SP1R1]|uniref:DUF6268 family outer membrane beta-barrel protein n=1 Tax=Mucilaginibacter sp. SP1R1 TaxID=2723091 RepID=UPI00160E261C|nr:DUF6268 family outer membrane beta-barrel protein [Mucilaginibacter sp. SP1R1]MBB6148183.1 hypothetical protein [Mucilaginibacter sp. SP1R1]
MKTRILYLITIALISFKLSAQSQQSTPVEQSVAESTPLPKLGSFETDYTYSPFVVDGKKMNIQQVNGALTLPLINKLQNGKLDFLLAGVSYSGLFFSGISPQFGGSEFHAISVPLTFQKSFSPKYSLLVSFIPTLSSDLKDISGDDMLYSGVAMLKIRTSANFSYSVGAAYSKQFFGTLILPVFGIDWNISDKLSFSGTLPVSEKLNYQLSGKSAIGLNIDFGIGGGSYRLSKKMNGDYLQVQQLKGSLYYGYNLAKNFSINVSAGYNFTQQLDLYSKDQKVNWIPFNDPNKRKYLAEMKKPGVAIQSGISYRF